MPVRAAASPSTVIPRSSRCSQRPVRLAELAGLRYDPGDPRRSDIDLWLGAGNREPLTAAGIYQMITRRARARRTYDRIMTDTWQHQP
jgi:hypothetical protein